MHKLVFFALSTAAFAQTAILHHTFDNSTEGWIGVNDAVISNADRDHAKTGKSALRFDYPLDRAKVSPAILPTPDGGMARMGRLRFWVKADHDTTVGVILSEKKPGGGNYGSLFWCPSGVWQFVDLKPSDFFESDGPGDPVDANHKLDLDQIEAIGLIDFSWFFAKFGSSGQPIVVDKPAGDHTMLVDEFEVLLGSNPSTSETVVDSFDRGFLPWITLGGTKLQLASSSENPLQEPAMLAAYRQYPDRFSILLRRIGQMDLHGVTQLAFDVASERDINLMVSVELSHPGAAQGPRYQFLVYPPRDKEVFHVNVKLSDFEHDESSLADSNATLDPARIKSIFLTDLTGPAGGGGSDRTGTNRLWIGKFRFLR